jgi:hypothetical protein
VLARKGRECERWLCDARFFDHRVRESGEAIKLSPLFSFLEASRQTGLMTRLELIRLIGDVLRQLDNLKTNQSPGDLNGPILTELRNALAKQQLQLAISDLDEGTPAFLKTIEDILAFHAKLHGAIGSADKGVALVDNVKHFVKALDALVESRH